MRALRRPKGFDHSAAPRVVPLYAVCVRVGGLADVPLLAYAVPRPNILLGRDFLRGLMLVADWQAGRWALGRSTAWGRALARLL